MYKLKMRRYTMLNIFKAVKNWWYRRYNSTFELFYEDGKSVMLELRKGQLYISKEDYDVCCNNVALMQVLSESGNFIVE